MNERSIIKVLIRTADGRYLAREGKSWKLTEDRTEAAAFDYPILNLADQIAGVPNGFGSVFILVPAEALKADEICDRCGRAISPSKAFFDGDQFLCPECRVYSRTANASRLQTRHGRHNEHGGNRLKK